MTNLVKRVVVLAPMQPELKAIVKSFGLRPAEGDDVFTHFGSAGDWSVVTLVTGMGPAVARGATQRALAAGPCEHVMVVGIAGGLAGFALGYALCIGLGSIEIKNPFVDANRLPLSYNYWHYAIALGVALFSSLAAGYLPARKAARMHPVDIIRGAT